MIDPQNIDFHEIARRGDVEVMEAFLDAGLNPSLVNERDHSLLMIAAYNDQPEMVDLLIERGAKVDDPDGSGNSPLMGLCFKGNPALVERLLKHGADPNARNNAGATALWQGTPFTGVPATPQPAHRNGLRIVRKFMNLDGTATNLDGIKRNDKFVVLLEGEAQTGVPHQALVTHGLPAGWEIETVRLTGDAISGFSGTAWLLSDASAA